MMEVDGRHQVSAQVEQEQSLVTIQATPVSTIPVTKPLVLHAAKQHLMLTHAILMFQTQPIQQAVCVCLEGVVIILKYVLQQLAEQYMTHVQTRTVILQLSSTA
jgi:hypothetical protein